MLARIVCLFFAARGRNGVRRGWVGAILGLLLTIMAGAPAWSASPGVLVIGAEGTIPPLDPHRLTGTVGLRIIDAIFDPLVREDMRSETKGAPALTPGLAESWSSSADGRMLTMRIRTGVVFHDGTPLDAAAVKANFDRLIDKGSATYDARAAGAMSFLTRWIASTDAPDAGSFVIALKEPFAELPRLLADRRMGIVSPRALSEHKGDALGANPVGTGPFTLDRFVQGQQLDLRRWARYWGGAVKVERVVFRQIPDPTTMATALQTGDIDVIPSANAQQVQQLQGKPGIAIQYPEPPNQYFVRLNTRVQPTANADFRRALNFAINRQAIVALTGGQVAPLGGPVPGGNEIFSPGMAQPYGYDPAKARQLLAATGIAMPVTMRLYVPNSGPGLTLAPQVIALIQQDLRAVGVNLVPQFLEFAALVAAEGPGYRDDVHGSLNGWATGVETPYWLERMFGGAQQPPQGVNRGWFRNEKLDALFDRARVALDTPTRRALYVEAAELVAAEAPWVFLYQDRLPRIYRERVTGLAAAPSVFFDYPGLGLR
ncbi:MAG: ABC transporter substrate-binding protein [Alphaproteobacteria bacterium]|nr:ABC transporter substrate-binding protein [Alphaproteobacteria bacterium]